MTVAMAALLLLVFFIIVYPLFRKSAKKISDPDGPDSKMMELVSRKEQSYTAINELEMDHRTGKLSDSDYENYYESYKAEALEVIKEQEEWESKKSEGWETAVEEEIAQKREELGLRIKSAGRLPDIICPACGKHNRQGRIYCSACREDFRQMCRNCRSINPPAARFCKKCGETMQRCCPHCQFPCDTWARFCPQCGKQLIPSKETT